MSKLIWFAQAQEQEPGSVRLQVCNRQVSRHRVRTEASIARQRFANLSALAGDPRDVWPRGKQRDLRGTACRQRREVIEQCASPTPEALVVTTARGSATTQELGVTGERHEVRAGCADRCAVPWRAQGRAVRRHDAMQIGRQFRRTHDVAGRQPVTRSEPCIDALEDFVPAHSVQRHDHDGHWRGSMTD